MKIITADQIRYLIDLDRNLDTLITLQRNAFIDFSAGEYITPTPMQLHFTNPFGDCHIKSSVKKGDDMFVVKIATGFYNNADAGIPTNDGVMVLFSQKSGLLCAILHDNGFLTTLRTAIAAVIATTITPWKIQSVGIVGSGALASQVYHLMRILYPLNAVQLYGRNLQKAQTIVGGAKGVCQSIEALVKQSDIIITTTASTIPILTQNHNFIGNKHIIALGADDEYKSECDFALFAKAATIIVDSKTQASKFGDVANAIRNGIITINDTVEFGTVLKNPSLCNKGLIITDLTGISPQDLAIAKFVIQQGLV